MAEVIKSARPKTESEEVLERAKNFWDKSGKIIAIVLGAIILFIAAFLVYKLLFKDPNEKKAQDAIFSAQGYFASDSLDKALNGDGQYSGFEKVISQYGSTKSGELAKFYAGSIYLKKGNFDKAIKYLSDFSTDAPQIQARAYKLLGDAYAEAGKGKDAVAAYKKSANEFPDDDAAASEALFLAAYASEKLTNDKEGAIELYKKIKKDYSQTQWGFEADKHLAAAGIYSVE